MIRLWNSSLQSLPSATCMLAIAAEFIDMCTQQASQDDIDPYGVRLAMHKASYDAFMRLATLCEAKTHTNHLNDLGHPNTLIIWVAVQMHLARTKS